MDPKVVENLIDLENGEQFGWLRSLYVGRSPKGKPCDTFKSGGSYLPNKYVRLIMDHLDYCPEDFLVAFEKPEFLAEAYRRGACTMQLRSKVEDPHCKTIAEMLKCDYDWGPVEEDMSYVDHWVGKFQDCAEPADFITTKIHRTKSKQGKPLYHLQAVDLEYGQHYETWVVPEFDNYYHWKDMLEAPDKTYLFTQARRARKNKLLMDADFGPYNIDTVDLSNY